MPYFLANTAFGNQVRAGLTMSATQLAMPITQSIDQTLIPNAPEEADFVSAISLYGDIQDNIFGGTRTKSILLGLAAGDAITGLFDKVSRDGQGYGDNLAIMYNGVLIYHAMAAIEIAQTFTSVGIEGVGDVTINMHCTGIHKKNIKIEDLIRVG
jgi:hypothetical protein